MAFILPYGNVAFLTILGKRSFDLSSEYFSNFFLGFIGETYTILVEKPGPRDLSSQYLTLPLAILTLSGLNYGIKIVFITKSRASGHFDVI